jgi:predicted nucleic acid-binding protein
VLETVVVSDTSPIQYLHQADQLHLLPALFGQVVVPPAVVAEIAVGIRQGNDLPDLARLPWIVQRTPAMPPRYPGSIDLDAGEREAIALALELRCRILIDEKAGREVARRLGVGRTGTLGVLISAKLAGLVPAISPLIDRIVGRGYRLNDTIRAEALLLAGESGS